MRKFNALASCLIGCMAVHISAAGIAHGQSAAETMETSRGVALGTGLRASALSTAALMYNPASLSLARVYHIEGSVNYEPGAGRVGLTAAAVDSMLNEHFAAGLAVKGVLGDGDQGYSGFDSRLGLGIPIADVVGIGVAGRFVSLSPDVSNDPNADANSAKGFTMDASLRFSIARTLHLAALAYNIINLDSMLAPVTLGGAASLQLLDMFSVGTDVLVDLTSHDSAQMQIGGGIEMFVQNMIPIRAGYFYDAAWDLHAATAGVGYVAQNVGIELALRQAVLGGNETYMMATFRYFVY